jgi:two-component system chemotaxis sensor kinase CheA
MEMAHDPYKYFRVEARELVDQLGRGLLDIERGAPPAEQVQRLLRAAHTLKGAARIVKQAAIATAAHAIEDILAPLRDQSAPVPRSAIDAVLKLVDQIAGHISALGLPEVDALSQPGFSSEEPFQSVRADVADMDKLFDAVTAAHTQLASLRHEFGTLERARHLAELLVEQFTSPRGPTSGRTHDGWSERMRSIAEELAGAVGRFERGSMTEADRLEGELKLLRETAEHLRLIPVNAVFSPLERTARDTGLAMGKKVRFEGLGGDLRLDAPVLAGLQGALLHVVRNAVAHGIEPEAERRSSGKPAEGRIQLRVTRAGRRAIFACTDDGRGIDLAAVRRAVESKGLAPEQARALGQEELLRILLKGGISTASGVTDVSGRGIGLDVVREIAERFGGEVNVRTETGIGTTVEIAVPLLLASLDALLVETAGTLLSVPLENVRQTLHLSADESERTSVTESILFNGTAIPFVPLNRILKLEDPPRRSWSVIVLQGKDTITAFGVEHLRGIIKMVLRPLPELAPGSAFIAGAMLDGEGNPQLVLDAEELIAEARRTPFAESKRTARPAPILIIDDSLTTRMLEQSILESAGYDVEVAASAEEAIEKAQHTAYALFLVDIEMPGMDGFAFLERANEILAMRHIPSILVSSRASSEDKRRGFNAGAKAYIAKSEFNQADLLNRIRELVA